MKDSSTFLILLRGLRGFFERKVFTRETMILFCTNNLFFLNLAKQLVMQNPSYIFLYLDFEI